MHDYKVIVSGRAHFYGLHSQQPLHQNHWDLQLAHHCRLRKPSCVQWGIQLPLKPETHGGYDNGYAISLSILEGVLHSHEMQAHTCRTSSNLSRRAASTRLQCSVLI